MRQTPNMYFLCHRHHVVVQVFPEFGTWSRSTATLGLLRKTGWCMRIKTRVDLKLLEFILRSPGDFFFCSVCIMTYNHPDKKENESQRHCVLNFHFLPGVIGMPAMQTLWKHWSKHNPQLVSSTVGLHVYQGHEGLSSSVSHHSNIRARLCSWF